MEHSNNLLNQPLVPRRLVLLFLALAIIGFLDASYLAIKFYSGTSIFCRIGNCDLVTGSKYGNVFGIPVSLVGALYYFILAVGIIAFLDSKRLSILKGLSYFTFCGLAASVYFVSVQVFVLRAFCLYCLISASTSTLLFIVGIFLLKRIARI